MNSHESSGTARGRRRRPLRRKQWTRSGGKWELFVENLEVARCEQAMALAEAERANVARRSKSEGSYGFGLARPRIRARLFYQ
jgi:hypothetical protein